MDRNILTSVDHTWWHLRDYDRALEYVKRRHYGESSITKRAVHAVILVEQGHRDEGLRRLREIEETKLTDFFRDMMVGYRASLDGRWEDSLKAVERLLARVLDAETLWQLARLLGEPKRALATFDLSLEKGFIIYRIPTREDPWLDSLRSSPDFQHRLRKSESRYLEALSGFRQAGGGQLLGIG